MSNKLHIVKTLTRLLLTLIECDKKVPLSSSLQCQCEIRKEVLCEIPEFEPFSTFELVKQNEAQGHISTPTLVFFLRKHKIPVQDQDMQTLLRALKAKEDSRFLYSEFLNLILPNKRKKLREKVLQRQQTFPKNVYNESKILFALAQIFDQELYLHRQVEDLRQVLFRDKSGKELNLIQAFSFFDQKKTGSIRKKTILKFLNSHITNAKFSLEDIHSLFRRLDLDEDQPQLSYLEFVNALLPWEKKKRFVSPQEQVQSIVKQHQPKIKSSYAQVRKKEGQSMEKASSKVANSFLDQPIVLKSQNRLSKGRNEPALEKQSSLYVYTSHQSIQKEKKRPKTTQKGHLCSEGRESILKDSPGKQSLLQQIMDMEVNAFPVQGKENEKEQYARKVNEQFLAESQEKKRHTVRSSMYTNTVDSNSERQSRNRRGSQLGQASSFVNTPQQNTISSTKKVQKRRSFSSSKNQVSQPDNNPEEDQKKWDKYSMMRRGYKSPMPRNEEELFMGIMKEQLRLERELQVYRENLLIKNVNFNPVQAYRVFSQSQQNGKNLTVEHIYKAYADFNLKLTEKEAFLLMKRYDSNRDGLLTYTDVSEILVPKDFKLQNEFNKRIPFGLNQEQLDKQLFRDIRVVLEKTVEVEKNSENLKKWLLKRKDFDMKKAFSLFRARQGQQKVGQGELQDMLKAHGVISLDNEILGLFQRFDKDKDGIVSFQDFERELSPLKYREMKKLLS